MHRITEKEFSELDLGDIRRNKRFTTIIENVINHPGQSIPQQNEGAYDTKATYNFFKNKHITLEKIQQAIHAYGAANVSSELDCVLILHDSSIISYNNLQAEGLGYTRLAGRGLMLHTSMVADLSGNPLALLYQQIWARDKRELGRAKDRQKKNIEDKESYKWIAGIESSNTLLGNEITKVHIADREADVYEVFFSKPEVNAELLIRACRSRKITGNESLWNEISSLNAHASLVLQIPDIKGHKKTSVSAEVRYKEVEILCPKHSKSQYESVTLTAIEVRQPGINDDKEGIWWKLLTTLTVNNIEDVKKYIRWYTYRWLIERFHYVIKSGCGIEDLQLKQAESLKKAIVMYSLAGFKIMQLTYQSRATPDVGCDMVLTTNEWEALFLRMHKTESLPTIPPTLAQAAKWIGRLGGHMGRKSDGPPGLKTIWRGYQRLRDFTELYTRIKSTKNLGND
jgi:Transposase DNA-binding/Transposase Tn5 dimerisation domain